MEPVTKTDVERKEEFDEVEKANLFEVHRRINKNSLKTPEKHKHVENLYKLDNIQRCLLTDLQNRKRKEIKAKEAQYPFYPHLNKTIALNKELNQKDLLKRNTDWIEKKTKKIVERKMKETQKQEQREELEREKPHFTRKRYEVKSQIKRMMNSSIDHTKRRALSVRYKRNKRQVIKQRKQ